MGSPPGSSRRTPSTVVESLRANAIEPTGDAFAWFYDPPWTIPFRRRNEVAVPLGQSWLTAGSGTGRAAAAASSTGVLRCGDIPVVGRPSGAAPTGATRLALSRPRGALRSRYRAGSPLTAAQVRLLSGARRKAPGLGRCAVPSAGPPALLRPPAWLVAGVAAVAGEVGAGSGAGSGPAVGPHRSPSARPDRRERLGPLPRGGRTECQGEAQRGECHATTSLTDHVFTSVQTYTRFIQRSPRLVTPATSVSGVPLGCGP